MSSNGLIKEKKRKAGVERERSSFFLFASFFFFLTGNVRIEVGPI